MLTKEQYGILYGFQMNGKKKEFLTYLKKNGIKYDYCKKFQETIVTVDGIPFKFF